jgi:hypothetical protein
MNSTITNFWTYFKENNFVFLLMTEIPKEELEKHFSKLNDFLCLYNKDLDVILKNGKNKSELIITANGNPYLFKDVELLVHYAPSLERWKITAFLQPERNIDKFENGTDKPLEYYGINLKISQMYFIPLENSDNPNRLGIRVFLNNYILHKDNPRLKEAVYTHIEHLIGEKAFANDINFIELVQLTADTKDPQPIELCYLNDYLREFNDVSQDRKHQTSKQKIRNN